MVLAVNKIDLVGYDEAVFHRIVEDYRPRGRLRLRDAGADPAVGPLRDNVLERGANMPWYAGPTLVEHLETVERRGRHAEAALSACRCSG